MLKVLGALDESFIRWKMKINYITIFLISVSSSFTLQYFQKLEKQWRKQDKERTQKWVDEMMRMNALELVR